MFAADLGGADASATACSLIDFAGYMGSIVLMLVSGTRAFSRSKPHTALTGGYDCLTTTFH